MTIDELTKELIGIYLEDDSLAITGSHMYKDFIRIATHVNKLLVKAEIEILKREMTCENEFRFKILIAELQKEKPCSDKMK